MTVFKGYLRGTIRQKAVIILYLFIFLGLGILMTLSMDEADSAYQTEKLTMTVIDRDHSTLSEALVTYFENTQDLVQTEDDKEVLTEELYYGNIQYVLVIPEKFEKNFEADDSKKLLEGTGRPGSVYARYASKAADTFLSGVSLYKKAGYSIEEAVEHMQENEEEKSMAILRKGSRKMSRTAGTLQYLPYVITALSCYVIGFVMLEYKREDIRKRLEVSAVKPSSRMLQMMLAMLVVGAAFYIVSILMTMIMNPGTVFDEPNKGYYLINIGTMVITGLSIAFLVVHVAGSKNSVNGLANVIALGMSFICGVFIPDSMLGSSVRAVSKYLPVYWYEQNNTILGTHSSISAALLERLKEGYLKQLIFAAAVVAVVLMINKVRTLVKR